jgi:hypothetical protein
VTQDRAQGHDQRDSAHLRNIDQRSSVLSVIQNAANARRLIAETFGGRPDLVIIYQGVAKEMSTRRIAVELGNRGLRGDSQTSVRRAIALLEVAGFVRKPKRGPHVALPGWDDEFGLGRELNRMLRKEKPPVQPL